MRLDHALATLLAAALLACGGDDTDSARADAGPDRGIATAFSSTSGRLSPEEVEAGRLDGSWRSYADEARAGRAGQPEGPAATDRTAGDRAGSGNGSTAESWDDISPNTVNAEPRGLPLSGDIEGPSVARLQILLDLAGFSPGVIDGRWGSNTEKAVYWFQDSNGLDATGEADRRTMERLGSAAGVAQPVRSHTLTEADVAGPFRPVPDDPYDQERQECLCYESLREKLGEIFHSTPELLEQLNPDVDLASLSAGRSLQVPAVRPFHAGELPDGPQEGTGEVARIVISDGGRYLHALDSGGDILYHFPSTLGADYSPSPTGDLTVETIHFGPTWHYQPDILTGVDDDEPDAIIPAGPNNAVGVVWMQLSREHYGIHGTDAPETIGYATSNGCVRLTNWDAAFLAQRVAGGTTVEFRDIAGR